MFPIFLSLASAVPATLAGCFPGVLLVLLPPPPLQMLTDAMSFVSEAGAALAGCFASVPLASHACHVVIPEDAAFTTIGEGSSSIASTSSSSLVAHFPP
jgi:hypothetical protein